MNGQAQIVMLPALEDNFAFIVFNVTTRQAVAIDTPDPKIIEKHVRDNNLHLTTILNTHHHFDHVGGNLALAKAFPDLQVYGFGRDATRIPGLTHQVAEGDHIEVAGLEWTVMETPGHTRGHICYLLQTPECPNLFCGDTVFGAGCGKLFEGTYEQMLASLKRVRSLPPETKIWCAHEYTEKNLWVATQLEPENEDVRRAYDNTRARRAAGQPSVPLTLADEKEINPFLRWDCPKLRATLKTTTDLATFQYVRDFRDRF